MTITINNNMRYSSYIKKSVQTIAVLLVLILTGSSNAVAQVTVSITGPSSVCPGSTANYFANAQGGTGPYTYQWLINGEQPIGSQSSNNELTTSSLSGGQTLTCYVLSETGQAATSNGILITALQQQAFSITISTNSYNVCSGSTVTFTATSTLPISTVQWQDAATGIEANGTTFTAPATTASALESISVTATTAGACVLNTSTTASTSSMPFTVMPLTSPSLSLSQSPVPAIEGSPVTFTVTPSGQGNNPGYQWQLNGVTVSGVTGNTYTPTISTGSDVQAVSVSMTSTGTCPQNPATTSSSFQLASSDWENQNYIRTQDIFVAGVTNWIAVDHLSIGQKREKTSYLDGLGRIIQKMDKSGSLADSSSADLVLPFAYDPAGRTTQKYLSYATTDNPGKFKSANVLTEQAAFVTSQFGEPAGAPTYTQIGYDNSPLNRVVGRMAPGQSWGGRGIGTGFVYDFNSQTEDVQLWQLGYTAGVLPTTTPSSVYTTGTLYRVTSTDEKGRQMILYIDFSGDTILKKVQVANAGTLTAQQTGWASTYYVYDELNQLRFIIPPAAVDYLNSNGWTLTQQLVNDLCYVYTYDALGRAISKKQPGVGSTSYVYDQRGRIVFFQDANSQVKGIWEGISYDLLDRVTATGVLQSSLTQAALQASVTGNTGNVTETSVQGVAANLVVTGLQAGVVQYIASSSIVFNSPFSSDPGGQLIAYVNPDIGAPAEEYVAIADNPIPTGSSMTLLTQTFYDNYSQATKSYTTADNSRFDPSTNQQALPLPTQPDPQTRGRVTTMKVKVITNPADLTQGNWLETDMFYDAQSRVLQTQNDNVLGGTDVVTNRYDYAGNLWGDCVNHMSGSATQFTVVSKKAYDILGRLTGLSKNFNNTYFKNLASYVYDASGNLASKTLAPGYANPNGKSYMENLAYTYNIQGWLTGINKAYAINQDTYAQWGSYFGFYLGYDNADNQFAAKEYNGQSTGVIWKSQGDNSMRKFDFTYDNLYRLTGAAFNQRLTPADGWSNNSVDFSETVTYADDNGNIGTMKRMGIVPGITTPMAIDNLSYTYGTTSDPNSNQLARVDEQASFAGNGQLYDFKDGTNAAGTNDYIYDNNGNLVQDQNKGITDGAQGGVVYNYLNKPVSITIAGKMLIQYTYDATGVKLSKTVTNLAVSPNTSTTTTYDNEFVYQDNVLQYVLHEEGRLNIITPVNTPQIQLNAGANPAAVVTGKQGVFEYFIKDQLSNVRMVLTEEVQSESYIATMEETSTSDPNLGTDEAKLFGQVDPTTGNPTANNEVNLTRTNNPSTLWTSNTSSYVSDLTAANGSSQTIGPNMLLKVTAGDMIHSNVQYYYYNNAQTAAASNGVSDVLTALMGALVTANAPAIAESNTALINSNLGASTSNFSTFITNNNGTGDSSSTPKAFLNIIFFDEQFNFIPGDPNAPGVGTNVIQVSAANAQDVSLILQQKAPKNGWVYIYLSNESNQDVYFDNFSVVQTHSQISEETHYYAFGEKIAGISTLAFNKVANKYKYQGDFSEEEENTLWNEFDLRMYDPQTGRWTGVDPYDQYASPYIGMGNDPINQIDPDGGDVLDFSLGDGIAMGIGAAAGTMVGALLDRHGAHDGEAGGFIGFFAGGVLGFTLNNIDYNVVANFFSSVKVNPVMIQAIQEVVKDGLPYIIRVTTVVVRGEPVDYPVTDPVFGKIQAGETVIQDGDPKNGVQIEHYDYGGPIWSGYWLKITTVYFPYGTDPRPPIIPNIPIPAFQAQIALPGRLPLRFPAPPEVTINQNTDGTYTVLDKDQSPDVIDAVQLLANVLKRHPDWVFKIKRGKTRSDFDKTKARINWYITRFGMNPKQFLYIM
jgi:RHS repeat-associated protein